MKTQMKVLIAYDGRHPVQNLVQDLKNAGLSKKTKVLVLTVVDAFMLPSGDYSEISLPESSAAYIASMRKEADARIKKDLVRARKIAEGAAKTIRSSFHGWAVEAEACVDSPNWAIIKKADSWKPDLIVMGSHGASPMAGFFLGSVTRSVLIHSQYSVRIVRHSRRSAGRPVKIMIGMDGSEGAQMALNAVAHRAWPPKTAVRLVSAFEEHAATSAASHYLAVHAKAGALQERLEKVSIRQMEAPFVEKLESAGLQVSEKIQKGKPWKVLADEAKRWGADCIFVGARGLGAWKRFLLGSVSNAVASRAHCSVEVVRGRTKKGKRGSK